MMMKQQQLLLLLLSILFLSNLQVVSSFGIPSRPPPTTTTTTTTLTRSTTTTTTTTLFVSPFDPTSTTSGGGTNIPFDLQQQQKDTHNDDPVVDESLGRIYQHLEKLEKQELELKELENGIITTTNDDENTTTNEQQQQQNNNNENNILPSELQVHIIEYKKIYRHYIQHSASSLKEICKVRKLSKNGRKPNIAHRLSIHDLEMKYHIIQSKEEEETAMLKHAQEWTNNNKQQQQQDGMITPVSKFASLTLSSTAANALGKAGFTIPSPIQRIAIPQLIRGTSAILHAETGSGKSLAYLLPITERLWKTNSKQDQDSSKDSFGVILTPTRELAAQVAGIASVLAPPGTVRLIFQPTDLMKPSTPRERGQDENGNFFIPDASLLGSKERLFIGSAKSIYQSLYGDLNHTPTSKPDAMYFLRHVSWFVLDEVDRLLHVKKSRTDVRYKRHERPAAVVASAVARLTLGRSQIIAASATVGRPLKRELSRVLGLQEKEDGPIVIRAHSNENEYGQLVGGLQNGEDHSSSRRRAVKIPSCVKHYVVEHSSMTKKQQRASKQKGNSDNENKVTSGQLLTTAYQVLQQLYKIGKYRRILMVLSRPLGISTTHAVGALRHFQLKPEPQGLLDALENLSTPNGDDYLGSHGYITSHQQISGSCGIGESIMMNNNMEEHTETTKEDEAYLFITGEDTVRGLHLDSLDLVVIVGRPLGPDEYTHIAGRTGRAGRKGNVLCVVSPKHTPSFTSWERMLDTKFTIVKNKSNELTKIIKNEL